MTLKFNNQLALSLLWEWENRILKNTKGGGRIILRLSPITRSVDLASIGMPPCSSATAARDFTLQFINSIIVLHG